MFKIQHNANKTQAQFEGKFNTYGDENSHRGIWPSWRRIKWDYPSTYQDLLLSHNNKENNSGVRIFKSRIEYTESDPPIYSLGLWKGSPTWPWEEDSLFHEEC